MDSTVMTSRYDEGDPLDLLRPVGIAAGATIAATIVIGVLIGVVAAARTPGLLRFAVATLTVVPTGVGAFLGARRAQTVLGRGVPAAATGFSGAMIVTIVFALMSLLDAAPDSVVATVLSPVLGALLGGYLGGARR